MLFEKFDIITLENGKEYTVSQILNLNNNKYLHLVAIDENEELLDEVKSVKVITDGKNFGIEEIKDQEELLEIQEIFLEMLEQDYNEE